MVALTCIVAGCGRPLALMSETAFNLRAGGRSTFFHVLHNHAPGDKPDHEPRADDAQLKAWGAEAQARHLAEAKRLRKPEKKRWEEEKAAECAEIAKNGTASPMFKEAA